MVRTPEEEVQISYIRCNPEEAMHCLDDLRTQLSEKDEQLREARKLLEEAVEWNWLEDEKEWPDEMHGLREGIQSFLEKTDQEG